jgi:preprotein translocase subunit YajC
MDAAPLIWLQAQPGAFETMVVPMLIMLVPLYFLLIRPEQKRRKEHEALLKALAKGDRVVTAGGIRGTVVGVTDDVLTLEIGKGGSVKIEVERSRIERKLTDAPKGEAK